MPAPLCEEEFGIWVEIDADTGELTDETPQIVHDVGIDRCREIFEEGWEANERQWRSIPGIEAWLGEKA